MNHQPQRLDPGDANAVSLELYGIAKALEDHVDDLGPMGEVRPFRCEALRLRQIAQMIHERCGKHASSSSFFTPIQ